MKGVTSNRSRRFIVGPLPGLAIALSIVPGQAAKAACPPAVAAPPTRDCPAAISSPPGLPTHGGTITVHPGIAAPCVVRLPGGAVLCAGGETAASYSERRPHGRAIFRISGRGPHGPGGLNIVVSASTTDEPTAPELLPRLYADAALALPPGMVLARLDAATGRFVPIRDARIRVAGLYKIVPKGASGTLLPAPSPPPATLPATGASPFGALLALAAALFVVGWGLVGRWQATGDRRQATGGGRRARGNLRTPLGMALCAGGVLLAGATGLAYAYAATRPAPVEFGTLTDPDASPAVCRLSPVACPLSPAGGATGPPTRLVIARLGIATPVVSLGIAGGQWQVPAYAAGYLSGGAWPGHAGNAVITGHDDRDGAVFRRLGDLHRGDVVWVYAGARPYRYAVSALRVVPATRTDLVRPTQGAILTLITCTPYLIDTQRLVVRARLLP
jgi:LPXTG-site transpeptidase (sortase) family protein